MRSQHNQNELTVRNREIYESRQKGSMVVELSERYSLSIPRIHRICIQEEVKDLREKNIDLENKINACENTLRHKK